MDRMKRLEELGLRLPEAEKPIGLYAPAVRTGNLVFLSGLGGTAPGPGPAYGKLGGEIDLEAGKAAARQAALAALGRAAAFLGGLDSIQRVVKVLGFVNCTPDFTRQPEVINGASALFLEVFGPEDGAHARSAVGVASLPLGLPVEIEVAFEVGP